MTALGQQEMFVPAPRRRLVVREGQTSWWGVDPSSRRVSIAWIDPDGSRGVRSTPFPTDLSLGALLDAVFRLAVETARAAAFTDQASPGLVLVEQPSGKQPNPTLSYAVGVTIAGVQAALRGTSQGPCRIETCSSSWWKKRACGRGDIYKPKRKADGQYGVLTWANQNGYGGSSWDEADAWGIAEAARREVLLEVR